MNNPFEYLKERGIKILFSVTVFCSSFLLFFIQPLLAKYFLPFFGGSASVWLIASLFFTAMLFFGYVYAYKITLYSSRTIWIVHSSLLTLGAWLLLFRFFYWKSPVLPPVYDLFGSPSFSILFFLFIGVGVQYFLLSSTGTIIQIMHAKNNEDDPYWLYSLSNLASFIALALFPFFAEPYFSLPVMSDAWACGFVAYAILMGISVYVFYRAFSIKEKKKEHLVAKAQNKEEPFFSKSFWKNDGLVWLMYSFLGAAFLLSVTSSVTRMLASVPFLWLIPLSLYLLSFVFIFQKNNRYNSSFFARATLILILVFSYVKMAGLPLPILILLVLVFTAFFSGVIFCHGELYNRRPEVSRLGLFNLIIAMGGVLGTLFVSLLAPVIFNNYYEFPVILYLIFFVALWNIAVRKKKYRVIIVAVLVAIEGIGFVVFSEGSVTRARNFYEVETVSYKQTKDGEERSLYNGGTIHGAEVLHSKLLRKAMTYYGEDSGVGMLFENFERKNDPGLRVGIIGLGAGTTAFYGKKNDSYTYYEINPMVIDFAQKYFSYLSDSKANIFLKEGDARTLLTNELETGGSNQFDIFIADAFSDDNVPIHLLTREAFGLYLAHLSKGGVIAVHVSSRYLDLSTVLGATAKYYRLSGLVLRNTTERPSMGTYRSTWVLLSRNEKILQKIREIGEKNSFPLPKKEVTWTDDFSNLFFVLR